MFNIEFTTFRHITIYVAQRVYTILGCMCLARFAFYIAVRTIRLLQPKTKQSSIYVNICMLYVELISKALLRAT